MAFEPVDIYVEDSQFENVPVPGALVRIFSPDGKQVFTEATTGVDGKVSFILAAQQYSMRFYKFQTSFRQPQLFTVVSDPATPGTTPNAFTVKASSMAMPVSNDPRLCRCSGYFRDVTGAPRGQLDIQFVGVFTPALVDGNLFLDERRTLKTTDDGFGCIDLVRGACYLVTMEGFEDQQVYIRVPDEASANLPDVLFPTVAHITFDTGVGPIDITQGDSIEVTPQVLDTVGVPYEGTAKQEVTWSVGDATIATVSVGATTITVLGTGSGTTQLTAVRKNQGIARVPDLPIFGVPVDIVVT